MNEFAVDYPTGVIVPFEGGESYQSVFSSYLAKKSSEYFSFIDNFDDEVFVELLEEAVSSGFVKADESLKRVFDAQNNLLKTKTGSGFQNTESLWLLRETPFHSFAKASLWVNNVIPGGYTPKSKTKILLYREVPDDFKKISCLIPEDTIFFDIETDTSYGYGLRPFMTQITEIAVTDKNNSWVFSGDERFILKSFANFLESSCYKFIIGWNNRNFDNIAIQTRALFHQIEGWGGRLSPVDNFSRYEPVGPSSNAYSLYWVRENETVIEDEDVFQLILQKNPFFFHGLKSYVSSLGFNPLTLGRSELHRYSSFNRCEYVLSDSLCTMVAYANFTRNTPSF